jgi:hypothetical protein
MEDASVYDPSGNHVWGNINAIGRLDIAPLDQ